MLDNETKTRINTARDILVGKVPDPKSQVEQITIALIYKFMDDMDKEAVSFGGNATFFTGEYEQYSWTNMFNPKLGGHEMLALYGEAMVQMNLNPNIPQLFRDIFKNAYLPYRDPETLKLFLKTINEFTYDHSEKLGDAFEFLLSILGSQGDAGQFRTPRHIIDFIVAVLNPQKGETVCDPACGTAGFLISAYKQIQKQNTKSANGDLLTPDDRRKLMQNFVGYDISPDMVRLSLVNMYLHGFTTPNIFEYDTLTSEDRWSEYYDVILANPPFMTPKGGIKPHKKFSIQANRSEVLFVDYIAEHIHPTKGRAGIIVPEGIIFQSAGAYKQLRKMLVDKNYLYAVVSLPAGIFNPYSGVKTSILLMDKTLATKTDNILFVKIENDGFDLGAQRKANDKNDLTACLELLQQYKTALQDNTPFESDNKNVFLVKKEKIGADENYNLSIDRYRVNENALHSEFEIVELDSVCLKITDGSHFSPLTTAQGYPYITVKDVVADKIDFDNCKYIDETNYRELLKNDCKPFKDDVLFSKDGTVGKVTLVDYEKEFVVLSSLAILRPNIKRINPKFLKIVLQSDYFLNQAIENKTGVAIKRIVLKTLKTIPIPLPPLSIQQQIVSKIEAYQKIIDGAKQVTENYKPQIDIDESWEMVKFGDVCKTEYGYTESAQNSGDTRIIRITDINQDGTLKSDGAKFINLNDEAKKSILKEGDLVVARTGATFGKTLFFNEKYQAVFASFLIRLNFDTTKVLPIYYWCFTKTDKYWEQANALMTGGGQPQFNANALIKIEIPLPPISVQQEIVKRIEEEQALVNSNKKLIEIFEQKVKDEINKLWQAAPKEYANDDSVSMAAEGENKFEII